MANILYITYDGLTSHIGEAQIVPYICGLAEKGHHFSVVSFEHSVHKSKIDHLKYELSRFGIDWYPSRFRSSPPLLAKLIDQIALQRQVERIIRTSKFDIIHSRSYVAAVAGLRSARKHGLPHLFDMRGFWVDQRREGGRWPSSSVIYSVLYKSWKRKERTLLEGSSGIIVLTQAALEVLSNWKLTERKPIGVIPCSYRHQPSNEPDDSRRRESRSMLGIEDEDTVLVYSGSLGSVYMLGDMLRFYAHFRKNLLSPRFFFLGSLDRDLVTETARKVGLECEEREFIFFRCEPKETHFWLNAGDLAICFITPTFSSYGVSPTKLAEYLAVGLPTVANSQVGDVSTIVASIHGSGVVVSDFTDDTFVKAAREILALIPSDRMAIRRASQGLHDLDQSIDSFDEIYAEIIAGHNK